jgi:mRNA interferase RelE/StbE
VSSIWSIKWDSRALKEVSRLPAEDQRRIVDAVEALPENPLLGEAMKGRWKGLRRIRVGSYRAVYALKEDELIILVLKVGHRKDVYR